LQPQYLKRDDRFIIVMSLAFVLGMAVALGVYLYWRLHAEAFQGSLAILGMLICPPFILALAAGPTTDSELAVVLTSGTIVFANAFLYAGVAAGLYFLFTVFAKRRSS